MQTGEIIYILSGHTGVVAGVSFSPDGSMLASCSNDKTIKIWNLKTGTEIKTLFGHTSGISCV